MKKFLKKILLSSIALSCLTIYLSIGVSANNYIETADIHGDPTIIEDETVEPTSAGDVAKYYPDGSYFSVNRSACTCHGTTGCPGEDCNCGRYKYYINGFNSSDGYGIAYQCKGFARFCYSEFNDGADVPYYESNEKYKTLTTDNLYSTLSQIGNQAYLSGATSTGYEHSIFLVSYTASTVIIYQANYGGNCLVRNQTLSYSDFIKCFKYLDWYYTADWSLGDV